MTSQWIVLFGLRASGKSTIGDALASRLRCSFVDLDDEVLSQFETSSVEAVWREYGEDAWRRAERDALHDVFERPPGVLALGGGTPMIDDARTLLVQQARAQRAVLVYLQCSSEVLAARLASGTGDRPSLTGRHPAAEVAQVLELREPTYLGLAGVIVRTDSMDTTEAVDAIATMAAAQD